MKKMDALKPSWITLMKRMYNQGMTDRRRAGPLSSIPGCVRDNSVWRGAASALFRRDYVARVSAPGGCHYWLTEKGVDKVGGGRR